MKAGIAIDNWKLPIFKRHLEKAGYDYTVHPGLTVSTTLLMVRTTSRAAELQKVVEAAQQECRTQ